MNQRSRAAAGRRPVGFGRLSALGLAVGLASVAALIAVQRPVLTDPNAPIALPSASATAVAASASPVGGQGATASPAIPSGPVVADRSLGSPSAPVSVTVWSDYQCPACGAFARTLLPRLVSEYVEPGRIRIEYRDFAFIGQESLDAAVGARCADAAGRFWPYHELVFANQQGENLGAFATDRLTAIAAAAGLEETAFRSCLADGSLAQAVGRETAAGRDLGVTATPTLIVGGQQYRGVPAWEDLVLAIESAAAR